MEAHLPACNSRRTPSPHHTQRCLHSSLGPGRRDLPRAATSGDHPELDALISRFHLETACRLGGALSLRRQVLDREQCLVHPREKGGADRWQPLSPTLMQHLHDHATVRNAPFTGQLLRYKHSRPITRRRYDHLWNRVGKSLPWVAAQGVTTHWLRHTTLTWVERTFSYAVAQAFAGHRGKRSGTTDTYVKSQLPEVAAALAVLTGEPHPLARGDRPPTPEVLAIAAARAVKG